MVHVVVFASDAPLQAVRHVLREVMTGWIRVGERVWIVAGPSNASEVRDSLGGIEGAHFLVLTLSGAWASRETPEWAEWLKGARRA